MKKLLAIALSLAMMTLSLCACGAQSEQSGSSTAENNDNSSKQVVTTEEVTTQPATEPDYETTNFIAQPPQGKPNYKIEEISLDEAAESSGYSLSDSKFRCTEAYTKGDYIVLKIIYSNINSTDFCAYNVIYDLNGNMVLNTSNLSLEQGCDKSGAEMRGIYGDYIVISLRTASRQYRYSLYNLKTKEIKDIDCDTADLDNGVIIIGSKNPEEDYSYKYGASDLDLNEIIPVEYEALSLATPELFVARKNEKFGLVNFDNKVVLDFKYNNINNFTGIQKNGSNNTMYLVDFENNINKYAIAITENDEKVFIDNKGNEVVPDFDVSDYEFGRIISQYDNTTYVEHNDRKTISDLDGNIKVANANQVGFINGYCICENDDTTNSLLDVAGNVIYSESSADNSNIILFPVDQKGLYLIVYRKQNGLSKTKIMDLSGNEVYISEESKDLIRPIGNGVFTKIKDKNSYSVFKVTAN